jgi:RNA polymerase sigma-70 factor (ECF subfamily)
MNLIQHLRRSGLLGEGEQSDGDLLAGYVRLRDEAAFAALVRRHGPMVWGVCRRVLTCEADAEDAFQAVFLVLARKAATIAPRERVGNWLHGVARTTALKARSRNQKRVVREREAGERPRPGESPVADLLDALDEEVGRLPEKYRIPIVLCDLEGRTLSEVAQTLGWPPGTVAGRLARARALLARRLQSRGVGLPAGALTAPVVPAALVEATVQTAGAGAASAPALILAEGVLRTMLLSQVKKVVLVVLAVAALAVIGLSLPRAGAQIVPPPFLAPLEPVPEVKALQGTWKAVAARWDEKLDRPPAIRFGKLVIDGDLVKVRDDEFRLRIVGGAGPKRMELKALTDGFPIREGDTVHLTFALDGDTLRIAYHDQRARQDQAATLDAKPGSGCVVLELKRQGADKAPVEQPVTSTFQLHNVAAAEAARVIQEVFRDTKVKVVPEPITNRLLVTGTRDQIQMVLKLIEKIDALPQDSKPEEPEVVVIRLKKAEAVALARVLNDVMGDKAARIIPDQNTNSLLIRANPKTLATIRSLIEKLDTDGPPEDPLGGSDFEKRKQKGQD